MKGGARPGAGRPPVILTPEEQEERRRRRTEAKRARRARRTSAAVVRQPSSSSAAIPRRDQPTWADKVAPEFKRSLSSQGVRALVALGNAPALLNRDRPEFNPFRLPEFPPGVVPANKKMHLAMDEALCGTMGWASQQWAGNQFAGLPSEGLVFPGYAYLSQLAIRPEYRIASETIADEMTRKWIRFRGLGENPNEKDDDEDNDLSALESEIERDKNKSKKGQGEFKKGSASTKDKTQRIKQLVDFMDNLGVKDAYYNKYLGGGLFGRMHLFHEIAGNEGQTPQGLEELKSPLGDGRGTLSKSKVGPKSPLTGVRAIEPIWTYPTTYSAINPLRRDFYNPQIWYTQGQEIHVSRLFNFIPRPVPDILKPTFSFGGISLSQLGTPYVDIWLQTRQAIAQLIVSFSTMVLSTDLQVMLQDPNVGGAGLLARIQAFNKTRGNQGTFVINKDTEEFSNVQTSLAGLHELQAQAQEHMCLPAGTFIETARGAIPIERLTLRDKVLTRDGFVPLAWVGVTAQASRLVEIVVGESVLRATPCHPIWSQTRGEFVPAKNVERSHYLSVLQPSENTVIQSLGAGIGGAKRSPAIIATSKLEDFCTGVFMRLMSVLSQPALMFITGMRIKPTISQITSAYSIIPSICLSTCGMAGEASPYFSRGQSWRANAVGAISRLCGRKSRNGVLAHAKPQPMSVASVRMVDLESAQPVYNLSVVQGYRPEFYANGILTHNCAVWRIPAVKYTGLQPTGLNASSEGEIKVFEDTIHGMQERDRPHLTRTIWLCMLSLWGEVDEEIVFDWVPLRELSEKEEAELGKLKAERDDILMNGCQAIGPKEVRTRLSADPDSDFPDLDPDEEPDLPEPQEPDAGGKINVKGNESYGGGSGNKAAADD